MDSEPLSISLKLIAVFALVGLNAFFVATEFALVSVRRSRMEALAEEGNSRALPVLGALRDLDGYIAATQLGITIASIGLGWIGEPVLASLLDPVFELIMPGSIAFVSAHGVAFVIAFAIITLLHVVFGELAPKSIALQFPEKTSMLVAMPISIFLFIFRPAIVFMNNMGRGFLRLVGVREANIHDQVYAVSELEIIIAASKAGGELEQSEEQIIQRALFFADQTAEMVMVPRTRMVSVPINATIEQLRDFIVRFPYSRFPVHGGHPEEIVGIVHVRDLMPDLINTESMRDDILRSHLRDVVRVPASLPIDDLLEEFKRESVQLAIVIDEFGGIDGMVTLKDIVSQLIGPVPVDDKSSRDVVVHPQTDGSTIVSGLTPVVDFNELFQTGLEPTETTRTIGGYLFSEIGKKPSPGDAVHIDGYQIVVEQMDGLRIAEVRVVGVE